MSTQTIERYSKKTNRKYAYLKNMINYFEMNKHKITFNQFEMELSRVQNETHLRTKESLLISLNKRLKIFKKDLENEQFNNYSNTRAFHLKASLKSVPLVLIYDKLFKTLECKGNFPNIMNIDTKVFLYPQDILALECQRLLVKTKPSNNISLLSIENFLGKVLKSYNHVAYHNFSHAFSVMQLFNFMIKKSPKIQNLVSQEVLYAGIVACLSHDLSHRKFNKLGKIINIKSKRIINCLYVGEMYQFSKSFIVKFLQIFYLPKIVKFLVIKVLKRLNGSNS